MRRECRTPYPVQGWYVAESMFLHDTEYYDNPLAPYMVRQAVTYTETRPGESELESPP